MSGLTSDHELALHVWPSRWDLPTFTPECLAAILYAQLTIPGKFVLEECTDPDLSPNGQLPYITHGLACVASFPSIIKYIAGLRRPTETEDEREERSGDDAGPTDLSAALSPQERAQQTAWLAYVSANLGDLVACSFYTLRHNYYEYARPILAELFSAPQRYYLPDRLRDSYKPRLEAAGLWSIHAEEVEEEKRKRTGVANQSAISEAFGKEKVLDKARTTLNLLSGLLGDKLFFFHDRPSTLDVLVAAHILLLTYPPLPNDLLRALVADSYPTLHAHARRMHTRTLSPISQMQSVSSSPSASLPSSTFDLVDVQSRPVRVPDPLRVRSAPAVDFAHFASSLVLPFPRHIARSKSVARPKSKADEEFARMRWAWYGLSLLGVVGWVWATGLRIVILRKEDPDEEEQFVHVNEEEEGEEEGEEDEEDEAS
ncbi:Tom37 C-terminal domain-containing protein [Phellopilus nigrolimitatus]|nr:Tom37 C-terminal domain-containing protein [Phellopilus nigrolimitatus]